MTFVLVSVAGTPDSGVAELKVSVQLDWVGPMMVLGPQTKLSSCAYDSTVTGMVLLTPPAVAVTVTVWMEVDVDELSANHHLLLPRQPFTVLAVAVKVADAEPAGTETLDGTHRTALLLLARGTATLLGDALLSVTVQVVVCPFRTADGVQASVLSTTGPARVTEKVRDPPFAAAVTTAVSVVVTEDAVNVNAAVVAEAATVTFAADSVALALLLERATDTPPAGAAADSVTVQLAVPGVFIVAGLQTSPLTVASVPAVTWNVLLTPPAVAVTVAD
ncbi:MAG: hypothetical protein IH602_00930 [Bryobacteraceae bacterium]|nr:hypothetical protein [Bryobacteraceae bacterium]